MSNFVIVEFWVSLRLARSRFLNVSVKSYCTSPKPDLENRVRWIQNFEKGVLRKNQWLK